jgi:hypothetical protein
MSASLQRFKLTQMLRRVNEVAARRKKRETRYGDLRIECFTRTVSTCSPRWCRLWWWGAACGSGDERPWFLL